MYTHFIIFFKDAFNFIVNVTFAKKHVFKKFKLEDQQVELEGEFYVDITGVCIITNLQNSTIT